MKLRFSLILVVVTFWACAALASDFGIHGGYYGNDLKEGFVGADLRLPLGPIVISPNVDYTRSPGVNWWFLSGDAALNFSTGSGGPSYWIGAGPTYGHVNVGSAHNGEWGWDGNAGVAWGAAGFRPYITGRYIKIKDFKTLGGAIGLRF